MIIMDERQKLKAEIREFNRINNVYKEKQAEISDLRKEKNKYEDNIINTIKKLNLDKKTLVVDDNQFQLKENKSYQTITYGYLKTCLDNFFNDSEITEEFIKYIKTHREFKTNSEIKIL